MTKYVFSVFYFSGTKRTTEESFTRVCLPRVHAICVDSISDEDKIQPEVVEIQKKEGT